MDVLDKEQIKSLTEVDGTLFVSIFLPTHRAGTETQQDPLRLKNLLKDAREQLIQKGLRIPDTNEMLEEAERLLTNRDFWQHQSDGLALFITNDYFGSYRLPIKFEQLVVVSKRFHIKPILPILTNTGRFNLLAISLGSVRLFQGNQYSMRQVELESLPDDITDALQYDDPEKQLQHQTIARSNGGRPAIFHGHGATEDNEKTNILRYFQIVDEALTFLKQDNAPLVVAGVEYLLSLYKEANSYPHLVNTGIHGNPEETNIEELHKQVWEIVEPIFHKVQEKAAKTFKDLLSGDRASDKLEEIIPAAYYGRVDTLFVPRGIKRWGSFNPETSQVTKNQDFETEGEDLLNLASLHTIINRGNVFVVPKDEMPIDKDAAATFRY
jgi:hypothetical protein